MSEGSVVVYECIGDYPSVRYCDGFEILLTRSRSKTDRSGTYSDRFYAYSDRF